MLTNKSFPNPPPPPGFVAHPATRQCWLRPQSYSGARDRSNQELLQATQHQGDTSGYPHVPGASAMLWCALRCRWSFGCGSAMGYSGVRWRPRSKKKKKAGQYLDCLAICVSSLHPLVLLSSPFHPLSPSLPLSLPPFRPAQVSQLQALHHGTRLGPIGL